MHANEKRSWKIYRDLAQELIRIARDLYAGDELFFKWIKQHLHIKSFYGTSENAVKTQIWIALSAYVIAAIAKKSLRLEKSLYEILQILSVSLFEKENLYQWVSKNSAPKTTQHIFQPIEFTRYLIGR
jgi:hypothetical protein